MTLESCRYAGHFPDLEHTEFATPKSLPTALVTPPVWARPARAPETPRTPEETAPRESRWVRRACPLAQVGDRFGWAEVTALVSKGSNSHHERVMIRCVTCALERPAFVFAARTFKATCPHPAPKPAPLPPAPRPLPPAAIVTTKRAGSPTCVAQRTGYPGRLCGRLALGKGEDGEPLCAYCRSLRTVVIVGQRREA